MRHENPPVNAADPQFVPVVLLERRRHHHERAFGHQPPVRQRATSQNTQLSLFRAGIALALCGDPVHADAQSGEAVKQYPKSILVSKVYVPLVRAAAALHRGNSGSAIQMLHASHGYANLSFYYQRYLLGMAWLREEKGAEAAREFQTILDHRGWSPLSPVYPLAELPVQRVRNLYTHFGQKQNLNVCSGQVRGLGSVEQPVADDLRRSLSRSSRAERRGGRNAELTFGLSR